MLVLIKSKVQPNTGQFWLSYHLHSMQCLLKTLVGTILIHPINIWPICPARDQITWMKCLLSLVEIKHRRESNFQPQPSVHLLWIQPWDHWGIEGFCIWLQIRNICIGTAFAKPHIHHQYPRHHNSFTTKVAVLHGGKRPNDSWCKSYPLQVVVVVVNQVFTLKIEDCPPAFQHGNFRQKGSPARPYHKTKCWNYTYKIR